MYVKNTTDETLHKALRTAQNVYPSLSFVQSTPADHGDRGLRVSVRISDESGNQHAPCWHVHAILFQNILSLNPRAIIETPDIVVSNKNQDGRQDDSIIVEFKSGSDFMGGMPYTGNSFYCACRDYQAEAPRA